MGGGGSGGSGGGAGGNELDSIKINSFIGIAGIT